MGPIWESLADDLTLGLLRAEGEERLSLRFVYEELPAFQEDQGLLAQRVLATYSAGLISARTARAQLGYDPDKEAKEIATEAPEPAPTPEPEPDDTNDEAEDTDQADGADE